MIFRDRRGGWAVMLAVLLAATARVSHAQDVTCGGGDVEVMKLTFQGNHAFPAGVLADGIVTAPSSFLRRTIGIVGKRRCLNRQQFPLDVLRLLIWYRNHGYASVTVDTVVTPVSTGKVHVRFSIHEGEPTILDSLSITGLDSVPERAAIEKRLPTRAGKPFDKYANDTTRELLTQRLHDGGYPDAEVFIDSDTRPALRIARASRSRCATGARMHLGVVIVKVESAAGRQARRSRRDGAPTSPRSRRVTSTRSRTSSGRSARSTRRRRSRRCCVVPDSTRAKGDTTVPVSLGLTEGYMHEAHAGIGYGTLDCFRDDRRLHQVQRSTAGRRASTCTGACRRSASARRSVGWAGSAPSRRATSTAKDLNYFSGATFSRPPVLHGVLPSFSLYSERRSEFDAYLRTTPVEAT